MFFTNEIANNKMITNNSRTNIVKTVNSSPEHDLASMLILTNDMIE